MAAPGAGKASAARREAAAGPAGGREQRRPALAETFAARLLRLEASPDPEWVVVLAGAVLACSCDIRVRRAEVSVCRVAGRPDGAAGPDVKLGLPEELLKVRGVTS